MNDSALLVAWEAEEAQPFAGWDFAHLAGRMHDALPPWDYATLVRNLVVGATSVLDLGTGGGEVLATFADVLPARTFATEAYPPNAKLAHARLNPHGIQVVQACASLSHPLPFRSDTFDRIIDRHTAYPIADVERVLRPGGVFLTQQVEGTSNEDLLAAFNALPPFAAFTLDFVRQSLARTNLRVDIAREWTGTTTFTDVSAVVCYLRAIPWFVPDFSVTRYREALIRLQRRLEHEGKLIFSRKLLLVQATKLGA